MPSLNHVTLSRFRRLCPQNTRRCYHGRKIGILPGSFNPPHHGHHALSRLAYRHLRLGGVWWLITPQNPFKTRDELADTEKRTAWVEAMLQDTPFDWGMPESLFGKNYLCQTLFYLRRSFPKHHFILLLGADNLYQLPRWYRSREIMKQVSIAVIRRDPEHYPALLRFRGMLTGLNHRYACSIIGKKRGTILYLDYPPSHLRGSEIRTR